jgi:hypothetical protein
MDMKRNHTLRWAYLFKARRVSTLMAVVFLTAGMSFTVMLPWGSAPVLAQEVIRAEEPTPSSVDEVTTPMERSFEEKPSLPGFFPWAKEQLKDTDPFFRDTKLAVNLRTFYFYRDKYDDSVSEAWAIGGDL